jgi:uncharacterized phage protein gp47/JayE
VTVSQGNYRWFYDTSNNRLYARGNGGNLNSLEMVIYAGVVWQAVQELETKWVAAGVGVDVIVPTTSRVAFILSYALEPGYTASTVEAALAAAVNSYVGTLRMGQTLEVEALYGVLGGVPGAGGVLLISPATNVTVERGYIIRVASVQVIRRG